MGQFDNFEICDHPFEAFVPEGCKILIIGTFPTHQRNCKHTFKFYYAGAGNSFWSIIETVFNLNFQFKNGDDAILERKRFLAQKRIGLTDMLSKAYRKNGRSQDEHIYPIIFTDIFFILRNNTSIETIIFTSRTRIIGALGLFETLLMQNNLQMPALSSNKVKKGVWKFDNREIEILVPYSTSNTIIEEKRATLVELVAMYRACLT